ncbi:MAG: DUF4112 domain-containing protein [Saprospiraceae bacterium]|nr:DUF4112 domain-containing protein [Saprospiraceae bacterium]
METKTTTSESADVQDKDIRKLETLAKLMDNQFVVPFTNWRFGLDGIIGLVPYVGDITGFVISGFLLRIMVKKGAGPLLMLRMMGNFVVDAIVGVVPFLGDLFDFGFKANRRNVNLLKAYYADGKAKPAVGKSVAFLGFIFFLMFVAMIWALWKIAAWLLTWVWGLF